MMWTEKTFARSLFLYVIAKLEYLTYEEFTYLLPLCVDRETTEKIIQSMIMSRNGELNYEDILLSVLMEMDNYKSALQRFQEEIVTEELICSVGMNRKSAKYDKPYYPLYCLLKKIAVDQENVAAEFYDAVEKLTNKKVRRAWHKYFFRSTARNVMKREGLSVLNDVPILKAKDENEFKKEFFRIMHLFKAKATLSDYFDLNRRYFKITDTVIFEEHKVRLDVLSKSYVEMVSDCFPLFAFMQTDVLQKNVSLEKIHPALEIDAGQLYQRLGAALGKDIADKESAKKVIRDERYVRFNKLIDERFDRDALISLLQHFEERNDDAIRAMVTDNADIPTIFEYVLGIIWYIISERKGDVLAFMNLSLEADLLPKTHAGGGEADIVWKYEKSNRYPDHTLLLEATLADGSNQRRMEMEPVSRHLGEYCLNHPLEEAYCVFITPYLHINVISDFRTRKNAVYYNTTGEDYITGMKILPLQTSELKNLLRFDVKYPQLYQMLDKAYYSDEAPKEWYENNIVKEIRTYGRFE